MSTFDFVEFIENLRKFFQGCAAYLDIRRGWKHFSLCEGEGRKVYQVLTHFFPLNFSMLCVYTSFCLCPLECLIQVFPNASLEMRPVPADTPLPLQRAAQGRVVQPAVLPFFNGVATSFILVHLVGVKKEHWQIKGHPLFFDKRNVKNELGFLFV